MGGRCTGTYFGNVRDFLTYGDSIGRAYEPLKTSEGPTRDLRGWHTTHPEGTEKASKRPIGT